MHIQSLVLNSLLSLAQQPMQAVLQQLQGYDDAQLNQLWRALRRHSIQQYIPDPKRLQLAVYSAFFRTLPTLAPQDIQDSALQHNQEIPLVADHLAEYYFPTASKVNPQSAQAKQAISLLLQACGHYRITDPNQIAYVLATAHWESHMGKWMREIGPKNRAEQYFNQQYAHKIGNGSVASGDGYRYRGRGFVQITGRANYQKFSGYADKLCPFIGIAVEAFDLLKNYELAAEPRCSAAITVFGMKYGKFRYPNTLGKFSQGDSYQFFNAREIVNGDKRYKVKGQSITIGKRIADIARTYREVMG
jgi:hypothetical protein